MVDWRRGPPSPYDSQHTAPAPDKGTRTGAGIPPFDLGHRDMAMVRPHTYSTGLPLPCKADEAVGRS